MLVKIESPELALVFTAMTFETSLRLPCTRSKTERVFWARKYERYCGSPDDAPKAPSYRAHEALDELRARCRRVREPQLSAGAAAARAGGGGASARGRGVERAPAPARLPEQHVAARPARGRRPGARRAAHTVRERSGGRTGALLEPL